MYTQKFAKMYLGKLKIQIKTMFENIMAQVSDLTQ